MTIKRRGAAPEGSTREHVEGDYANLEAGEYEARLVYVADLGLHANEYKGEKKADVQKLALGFEILENPVQIGGEMQPRLIWMAPFNIYNSLTEKGKEIIHYSVFDNTAEIGEVPEWDEQLGKPCSLVIGHNHDKKDSSKKYDTITKLQAIPAKYQDGVTKGEMAVGVGDADEPNSSVMKKLHGLALYTYKQRIGDGNQEEAVADEAGEESDHSNDFDDDIPF